MTLPQYQGSGYGRFLIDFSYLLSRREGLSVFIWTVYNEQYCILPRRSAWNARKALVATGRGFVPGVLAIRYSPVPGRKWHIGDDFNQGHCRQYQRHVSTLENDWTWSGDRHVHYHIYLSYSNLQNQAVLKLSARWTWSPSIRRRRPTRIAIALTIASWSGRI